MKLLVAIPCLNEEKTLASVLNSIPKSIPSLTQIDVLVIDDGSTDQTAQVAQKHGAFLIQHRYNAGVGISLQDAIQFALNGHYDFMVNIDGDGQFNPKDIEKLVTPLIKNQADFVTASRFADPKLYPKMPTLKFYGNKVMSKLVSAVSGKHFYDVSCGFRAYSREALLRLNLMGRFTYTQESFLDLSFKNLRIMEVPVEVTYFDDRTSRVANNLFTYTFKTLKIIFRTYRDYKPLKFFTYLSLGFYALSGALGAFVLGHYLKTSQFSPHIWAALSSGFFFLVGTLLCILGIVADMLDRIRFNQEKIMYYIKKTHDMEPGK